MKLQYITKDKCPICHCNNIIKEEHYTSGVYNEKRTFQCGYQVWYCSIFQDVMNSFSCKFDPNIIAEKKKKQEAYESLINHIDHLDVDEVWKVSIKYLLRNGTHHET